jgi:hypothetical protein
VSRIEPVAGRPAGRCGCPEAWGSCTAPLVGRGREPVRGRRVTRGTTGPVPAVCVGSGGCPSGRCGGGGASSGMRETGLRLSRPG